MNLPPQLAATPPSEGGELKCASCIICYKIEIVKDCFLIFVIELFINHIIMEKENKKKRSVCCAWF